MKVIDVDFGGGRIRLIRACRDCDAKVDDMGKEPRFCPKCGRKLIRRPSLEDSDLVGRIVEGYYREKEEGKK